MQKFKIIPKNLLNIKYSNKLVFIAVFALIGAYLVFSSSAAAPYTSSDITAVKTLGFYPGFGNEAGRTNHEKWESLLGRRITFADANLDHSNWNAFGGSSWGNFENSTSLFRNRTDVTPAVTIPLRTSEIGGQTTKAGGPEIIRKELQDTANGLNDARYKIVAERLVKYGQAKTILRIGHEADINYYPWSFRNGNEDVYIQAFKHVVDLFRSTPGNQFLIDYQGNGSFNDSYSSPRTGVTQPYGDAGYPGDAYVDIIGVDVYNRSTWANVKLKLDYTLTLAKKHNKPMSIPEWGLWISETGDDPSFIQNMYDWINTTPKTGPGRMVYHSYFQGNKEVDLEKAPKAKAKFIELFSEKGSGNPDPTNPVVTKLPDVIIVADTIKYSPLSPKSGDNITFRATVKNIGTAPTPEGTIHGVGFRIDGKIVSWSDNSTKSMAPGESRELIANGGPVGSATWVAKEGKFDVTAIWDDVERITESNEQNNNSISSITVAAGTIPPDVTVPPALSTVSLISSTSVPVNTPTSVDVKINSNGIPLKTASVRVLYDATKLDFVSVDESGSKFTGGGIPTYTEPGLIEINRFEVNGVSGNNLQFVKLNFITKYTTGNTTVTVGPSFLYQDSNSNSFSQPGSINAQINITNPVDNTPPVSKINTYPGGLVSSSSIAISVVATDNVAISRVALEIVGGAEIASDNISPYNLTVDTRTKTLLNGNYQLQAVSYDTSGNRTVSSPVLVKVRLTDIDRSGTADIGDLTAIISSWNQSNPAIATKAANDLDDDGVVGIGDLTKLISAWGR